jgi:hypothetical protein
MDVRAMQRWVPTTLLVSVMLGLVGVAFGQEAPDTWPVATPYGDLPVGHITLPVALVLFGTLLSRSIDRITAWRPSIQLVLHLEHHYPEGPRDDAPEPRPTPDG